MIEASAAAVSVNSWHAAGGLPSVAGEWFANQRVCKRTLQLRAAVTSPRLGSGASRGRFIRIELTLPAKTRRQATSG
jgi:hypothetical protein